MSSLEALADKTLVLTVTSGRSGTGLLTVLLQDCLGIVADHEPAPRVNYVLRSLIDCPSAARGWLEYEKLPAMLQRATGPIYAETSHLYCKGLIEPMLELGLRPRFIMLRRPAGEVARSLFQLDVVPSRSENGRLVLIGPDDPGVLPFAGWETASDYQLCFWYAREIERRQAAYGAWFSELGIAWHSIEIAELRQWDKFTDLCAFVCPPEIRAPSVDVFSKIISKNQNPRTTVGGGIADRPLPENVEAEEAEVDQRIGLQSNQLWNASEAGQSGF